MTIVESIKCVLQQNNDGLTSKQIYDEIIRQGLYSFGAENPVGVVNAQLRRRCIGLDFPTAYPIKFFEIAGYEGKKIKFRLISTENTATIITAPKTTDISELLPEEKIKAALQEHLQNIRQQVFDSVLNNGLQIFHRQGDANMRNKIIENAIDSVVNASNTSSDFKLAFRQYVKNKFDDNAKESDLKRILTLIEDDEEDIQV